MGKRGSENFAPVRKELFSLFQELKPVSDAKVEALKAGQSKGKIKKIERLVRSFNDGLAAGHTGLKLKLLVDRPGSIDPQFYKNNLVFETARKQRKKFVILWESGKYSGGYLTRGDAQSAIEAVLHDEKAPEDNEEFEVKTYQRRVSYIDLQGAGYLYVACNDSLPDMVKIGMTTTSVAQRLKELSNTSVPTPFYALAVFEISRNILAMEQELHVVFQADRIHEQREFFTTKDPAPYCEKIRDHLIDVLGSDVVVRMFPEPSDSNSI